jgi:anti-sigma factor RsiW
MSCEWRSKTNLYADDELEAAAQQELSAHLRECAECSEALAEQLALKKAVRVAGSQFKAPPELHAAVFRQLHPRSSASSLWKWISAAAAMAVVVLAFMLLGGNPKREEPMLAGLVDQHITSLASANPVDVVSEDRHTVKPWFQGKLGFTFTPPELAGSPFKLIGGKLVYVQQKPGAELLYTAGAHKISVFVFKAPDAEERKAIWQRSRSFNSSRWSQAGLEFFLVTDATQDEASGLVSLFQQANRS